VTGLSEVPRSLEKVYLQAITTAQGEHQELVPGLQGLPDGQEYVQ